MMFCHKVVDHMCELNSVVIESRRRAKVQVWRDKQISRNDGMKVGKLKKKKKQTIMHRSVGSLAEEVVAPGR